MMNSNLKWGWTSIKWGQYFVKRNDLEQGIKKRYYNSSDFFFCLFPPGHLSICKYKNLNSNNWMIQYLYCQAEQPLLKIMFHIPHFTETVYYSFFQTLFFIWTWILPFCAGSIDKFLKSNYKKSKNIFWSSH